VITAERDRKIADLYRQKIPISTIAREVNVTHPIIYETLERMGVPHRKRPWTPEEDLLLSAGLPDKTVEEWTGRPEGSAKARRYYLTNRKSSSEFERPRVLKRRRT